MKLNNFLEELNGTIFNHDIYRVVNIFDSRIALFRRGVPCIPAGMYEDVYIEGSEIICEAHMITEKIADLYCGGEYIKSVNFSQPSIKDRCWIVEKYIDCDTMYSIKKENSK